MSHPVNINPVRGLLYNQRYSRDLPAVIYEDRTLSYDEFAGNVHELAASLAASGVGEGDRVMYLGLNSEMFLRTMFATWWLGGVFEPLNFRLAPREVGDLLARSAPRVMIVEPGHVPVVDAALGAWMRPVSPARGGPSRPRPS
ncbi:AMP-binding protein [Kocuria atrinae]|uniref:AMP-binding protein n=1 Tax=Kocuria atrinae TaxID=592377 RepID=UPI0002E178FB|nr:AMP-binding protein [Kocuria atrinae]